MTSFQLSLVFLLAGGGLSWLVSWIYFRKTVNKRLSAYVQVASGVLADVDDPKTREALSITYRGAPISDLYQLQFVIANEGQRSIRDIIKPLTMLLPSTVTVLDARILHVEPTGRSVEIAFAPTEDGSTAVTLSFPVLNAGDFFIAKLLLNGRLKGEELTFTVSADDLPPSITSKSNVFNASESLPVSGWPAALLGILFGAGCWTVAYSFNRLRQAGGILPLGSPDVALISFNTLWALSLIGSAVYMGIRAIHMTIARGILGPRRRFLVPRPTENRPPRLQRVLLVEESALNPGMVEQLRQTGAARPARIVNQRRGDYPRPPLKDDDEQSQ